MRRSIANCGLALILGASSGCGLGPRNFRKIQHPAPLMRARALSLGDRRPGSLVVPALVGRLNDQDPVVRLAAHEELKRRTGQDFGYVPWAEEPERLAAVGRWKAWLSGRPTASPTPQSPAASPTPQGPTKALPTTTQYRQTIRG
jgi:hypothetical protein